MTKCIYLTGAKGGAGATVCTFRLALALAEKGERTLMIDGDAESGALTYVSGAAKHIFYTLGDAERGACRAKQAIAQHPLSPNLYIMPSLGAKDMRFVEEAATKCAGQFDYVLCDKIAPKSCDAAIAVCEPYTFSLKSALSATAKLKDGKFARVGIIVNKVSGGMVFDGQILTPQEYARAVNAELWGVVPEDLRLPAGRIKKETRSAFALIADFIACGGGKTYDAVKPYAGLKGFFKRKLRDFV